MTSTCTDGVTNGTETDVDCGGDECIACEIGGVCIADVDCSGSAICVTGTCTAQNTGTEDDDTISLGGRGCTVAASNSSSSAAWLGLVGLAVLATRRRRNAA